jgi:hypothetical protein
LGQIYSNVKLSIFNSLPTAQHVTNSSPAAHFALGAKSAITPRLWLVLYPLAYSKTHDASQAGTIILDLGLSTFPPDFSTSNLM